MVGSYYLQYVCD